MIATVIHVSKQEPEGSWGATAIYPGGVKPRRLELYAAAHFGNGAELTGIQVLDEFGTMSGPVLVVPESAVGIAYDGALSLAFERDEDLAIGSGWPPLVIPLETFDGAGSITAGDLGPLFAYRGQRVPDGLDRGLRYPGGGVGYAMQALRTLSCEAFVLAHDGLPDLGRQRVGIVVTDVAVGPRDLREIAAHATGVLSRQLDDRALTVAVSVATPIRYDPEQRTRRALDAKAALPPRPTPDATNFLFCPYPELDSAFAYLRAATLEAVSSALASAVAAGSQS
jgi:L-aminopeptidase/D-esterase-like protein